MPFDLEVLIQNIFQCLNLDNLLTLTFIAFFTSQILSHFAHELGNLFGVIDQPGATTKGSRVPHKSHAEPVPAVGGIVLFLSGSLLILADLVLWPKNNPAEVRSYLGIAIAVGILMLMGLLDDRRHINAIRRLAISAVVFGALLAAVPQFILHEVFFKSFNATVGLGIWAAPFTLGCLVAFQNAVNMVDGRNGLLLGLSVLWLLHLLAHASVAIFPIMAGFLVVFLVLFFANIRGRLFLGDCGSYGLASFFGIAALAMVDRPVPGIEPLRTSGIIIMFLIPSLDLMRVVFARLRAGRSPFSPDTNHLHHLLDNSMGWTRGWWVYMGLVGLPIGVWHATHQYAVWIIAINMIAYAALLAWAKARIRSKGGSGSR